MCVVYIFILVSLSINVQSEEIIFTFLFLFLLKKPFFHHVAVLPHLHGSEWGKKKENQTVCKNNIWPLVKTMSKHSLK